MINRFALAAIILAFSILPAALAEEHRPRDGATPALTGSDDQPGQASLISNSGEDEQGEVGQDDDHHLRAIGLAILNFQSVHRAFPARYNEDRNGSPLLSWRVHILPYLDANELYELFHLDEPWNSPHNIKLIPKMPKCYTSSETTEFGKTTFLAIDAELSLLGPPQRRSPQSAPCCRTFADVNSGAANTIMVLHADGREATTWTKPQDFTFPRLDGVLNREGVVEAVLCDGMVRRLTREDFQENNDLTFLIRPAESLRGATAPSQEFANPNSRMRDPRDAFAADPPTRNLARQFAPQYTQVPLNTPPVVSVPAPASPSPYVLPVASGSASHAGPAYQHSQQQQIAQLRSQVMTAADEEQREEKLSQLQTLLEQSFDAGIEAQGNELKRLEGQVAELKKAFERRSQNRDRVIANYVDSIRLQAEGLTIPAVGQPAPPALPSAQTYNDLFAPVPTQVRPQTTLPGR